MSELYRLISRKLPNGGYRCLILRDPTRAGVAPESIPDVLRTASLSYESNRFKIINGEKIKISVSKGVENTWLYGFREKPEVTDIIDLKVEGASIQKLVRIGLETSAKSECAFVERRPADGLAIGLFSDLPMLWKPNGTINEPLRREIVAAVRSFCTSHDVEYEDGMVESPGPIGPGSLIQVYLDNRPLIEVAQSDRSSSGPLGPMALAALSGYVFDTEKVPPSLVNGTASISFEGGGEKSEAQLELLDPSNNQKSTVDLRLTVDEEAEGFYIKVELPLGKNDGKEPWWKPWARLLDLSEEDKDNTLNNLSDHSLVVRRSSGPTPIFSDEVFARSPLLVYLSDPGNRVEKETRPEYVYIDRLRPDEFVGKLVHYQLEVNNVVGQTVAIGQISLRRRRLDPPRMPSDARAELHYSKDLAHGETNQHLRINVELPAGLTLDDVTPTVWFQSRPLDACGFFGTDDDMALEEGLRQADLNFEETADTTDPRDWEGHPVSRYLRGAYDKQGLLELKIPTSGWSASEKPTNDVTNEKKGTLVFAKIDEFSKLCKENKTGARIYVGLRRNGDPQPEGKVTENRVVESVLRPCEHYLVVDTNKPQRIFQIEQIPSSSPDSPWLTSDEISLSYVGSSGTANPKPNDEWTGITENGKPAPFRVGIEFSGHAEGPPPGGYRVWVRDVVGSDKPKFDLMNCFQALPPAIYRYRPYSIDSTKHLLRISPTNLENNKNIAKFRDHDISQTQEFFNNLSVAAAEWKGPPRIVRSVGEIDKMPPAGPDLSPEKEAELSNKLYATAQKYGFPSSASSRSLEDLFGHFDGETEFWKEPTLFDWSLLGPYVDWAFTHGLARDMILPFSVGTTSTLIESYAEKIDTLAQNHNINVIPIAIIPSAWTSSSRILATLRICVRPTIADEKSTAYHKLLNLAWNNLVSRGVIHFFQDQDLISDILPYDHSGVCSLEWHGIRDLWRHQLECVVERLDRYTSVRVMDPLGPPEPAASKEPRPPKQRLAELNSTKCTLDERDLEKHVKRIVVPRLMAAPPPPVMQRIADAKRVAFQIEDSPERVDSAVNLLNRVRSGRITRIVEFEYQFPWLDRYKQVFADRTEAFWTSLTPTPGKLRPKVGGDAWAWSNTDADEVEVRAPLFFLKYRISARHRADQIDHVEPIEGSAAQNPSAEAQCLPHTLVYPNDLEWSIIFDTTVDSSRKLGFKVPLLTLGHLIEDIRADYPDLPDGLLNLPDLEATYLILDKTESSRIVTLGIINLPGYSMGKGIAPTFQTSAYSEVGAADLKFNGMNELNFTLNNVGFIDIREISIEVKRADLLGELRKAED